MELINKRHENITSNQRVDLAAYFKIESTKSLYFSAGCGNKFGEYGLVPGLFVHFFNDEDKWFFYCSTDTDGFKLINRPGKNSMIICDASLVKLLIKRTSVKVGDKFLVTKTKAKHYGKQLIEIDFNKPVEIEISTQKSKINHE